MEGTVQVSAEDGAEPVAVSSGQYAEITKTDDVTEIQVGEFTPLDIPAYVFEDVVENEVLVQEILEASGMNMFQTEALQQSYASLLESFPFRAAPRSAREVHRFPSASYPAARSSSPEPRSSYPDFLPSG